MAKLFFRFGCMDCGKSTHLLQIAHNYDKRGLVPLIVKPKFDTRGDFYVKSRLGIKREVDYLVSKEDNISEKIETWIERENYDCILVDEAHFLTKKQARDLWKIATELDIVVIAYGLRVDYMGEGFDASKELLTLAHEIEELKTVDETGKKCTMHLRSINGKYVFEGTPKIVGDIKGKEKYESCTSKKWLSEYNEYQQEKIANQIDYRGGLLNG